MKDMKVRSATLPLPTFDIHWDEVDNDLHLYGRVDVDGFDCRVEMARHDGGDVSVGFFRAQDPEEYTVDQHGIVELPPELARYIDGHLIVKGHRSTKPFIQTYRIFTALDEYAAWRAYFDSLDGRKPGPEPQPPQREFSDAYFIRAYFDAEVADAIYAAFGLQSWAAVMAGQRELVVEE